MGGRSTEKYTDSRETEASLKITRHPIKMRQIMQNSEEDYLPLHQVEAVEMRVANQREIFESFNQSLLCRPKGYMRAKRHP